MNDNPACVNSRGDNAQRVLVYGRKGEEIIFILWLCVCKLWRYCIKNDAFFANGLRIFTIICIFAGVMNSQFANIHTLKCSEVQGKNAFFATFSMLCLVVCDILLHTQ